MKIKIGLTMLFVIVFLVGQHIVSYSQIPVISGGFGAPAGSGGYNNAGLPATGLGCGGGGGSWWGGTGGPGLFGGGGGGAGGYYGTTVNWSGGDGGQGVVMFAFYDGSNSLLTSELKISGTSISVPAGVSSIKVWAIGGGGGGGGATQNDGTSGGGGGAGGVAYIQRNVSQGDVISYTLGIGGQGGHGSIAATAGGTTSVTVAGTTINANGGTAGLFNNNSNSAGGTYSGGDGGIIGGYGEGSSGDIGGGGGGAIGGGNPASNQYEGGNGANAVDVSGLFAACAIATNPVVPALSSFTPTAGLHGTVVTIHGNGFSSASGVRFGGIAASYIINSDGMISATVANGTVSGSVSINLSHVTVSKPFYQYMTPPVPSVSSFSPSSGGLGTTVTINGSNFIGTSSVKFGGNEAFSFSVVTNSQITAVVATGSTGVVSVITSGGTASSSSNFNYTGDGNITWLGTNSNDWNVASNWSYGTIPTTNTNVVIPTGVNYYPVITGIASSKNLAINTDASLTVDPGGSLITTGPVTGNLTIKQTITGNTDLQASSYHLVSVPLHPDNNSLSELFLGSYLFGYNPVQNDWTPLGTSTSNSLDETLGYMIFYPESSTTYTFTGQPNTGAFTPTVTYAGNSGGNNFALVPNPFPSNIDWNAASGWTKTNIGGTIWVYNNGNYATWDGTNTTNGGSRYISVGQAFFVQTTAASPALIMNNGVRTHTSATFLKNNVVPSNQLRVKALANNMQDEIIAGFAQGMSAGYDPMEDALKFYGAEDAPQLYTLAGESKVSINQLSELNGSTEIPLHFETEFSGEIALEFSQLESFPTELKIRLEDKLTGQWVNLRETSQYIFTHNPTNTADRFLLHFGSATGLEETENQNISTWFSGNTLYLSTPEQAGEKARIEVFNTSGQLLFRKDVTLNTLQHFDVSAKGTVITRVTLRNKVLNTKAIVF